MSTALLVVSFGRAGAEVGFRSEFPWERLLDPSRYQPRFGFSSVVWDTLSQDTTHSDTSVAIPPDSLQLPPDTLQLQPDTSAVTAGTLQPSSAGVSVSTSTGTPSSGLMLPDTSLKQTKSPALKPPSPPSPQKESPADTLKPPPWRPTRVNYTESLVDCDARIDTSTGYIVLQPKLHGIPLPQNGAVATEEYLSRAENHADRQAWREAVLDKLPKSEKKTGTGINISIPVFKSKRAQQIFGGSNVGLNVTGDISISGSLRTEKRDVLRADNPNPTSYQFKIDQTQRFNIKGKVGEKVEVAIDQDSEKLFEFENSLRVTYTGNPDEIIQKIEAGNVNLSLGGAKLISSSTKHEGLFGLKTESRIGALKLTTIASLDKSEQQVKTIKGGAETGRPIFIDPQDFITNTYFFLETDYREHYRHRKADDLCFVAMPQERQIIDIILYKSVELRSQNLNAVPGWALWDPFEDFDTTQAADREHQRAAFLPMELGAEYSVDRELGYVKLTQRIEDDKILAAAYITSVDTVGHWNPRQPPFILKLIKPSNPQPSDSTWKLMWRHAYSLGTTGIDPTGFEGKIVQRSDGTDTDAKSVPPRSFIQAFGLDYFGPTGELSPDGQIDKVFLRYGEGELHFPDLQPFEPEGWFKGDAFIKTDLADTAYFNPVIYTGSRNEINNITTKLRIEAQYKNISATYDLEFGVLEGSEEVYLNGQRLSRDQDYSIDYISGTLTILRKDALAADADLEIKYQKGQLFQIDTQTMLGIRAEYELGSDSYIGATALHRSESGLDQRVRLGADPPMKNSIWGLNSAFSFKPQFMTRAVDWLPFIETNKESEIVFEGEVAQVFPNPNILNSASTGDNNGVAYIDDFESIKRTMSLGISRRQWTPASFPAYDNRGEGIWRRKRGRMIWFNPWSQVKITDIWPERQVQAKDNTTPVLEIGVQPWWTAWGAAASPGAEPEKSWAGVMRYLGAGFADQTQTKYLEIWLKRGSATSGEMVIDLGQISEDVIPNGELDTEDLPMTGFPFGNTILDGDEDTGIDGRGGRDPADSTDINGDRILLPSYDDYTYSTGNRDDYTGINGMEGNRSDESGRHPDSEDLDGDTYLDQVNHFYRYRIDLSQGNANRYIAGGLGNPQGWRLYRIPLSDSLTVGKPSLGQIEYVRLWFTGFTSRSVLQIAQMELVGNEWQEQKVPAGAKPPVKVSVINTNDNPDYNPPPGVSGELDPVTNLRAQEQSLALSIEHLGTGETGIVHKHLQTRIDLLDYRYLKMFVHGGGPQGQLTDRFGQALDVEVFVRLAADTARDYYEYSQRIRRGWDKGNEITLSLDRLASVKFLREKDSLRNYDILPDGDVIRVVGNPSLSAITDIVIGVKNHGSEITELDNVQIWLDEFRVSDVNRDPGWAARGGVDFKFADFWSIHGDIIQEQANFHDVSQRRGDNNDQLSATANTRLNLDRFLDAKWGIQAPLSVKFSQSVTVPKFKPSSDIRLTAISGEKIDIWSIFQENLFSDRYLSEHPQYQSPKDSLISVSKSYSYAAGYSKSKKSDNLAVRWTLDNIKLDGSYAESYKSDYQTQLAKRLETRGKSSYDFALDKPIEISWLGWAGGVPVLKKLSESKFKPLPSALSLSADANESYDYNLRRRGLSTPRYTYTIDRALNTRWNPFDIINISFDQSARANRMKDDSTRTRIADKLMDLDTTKFWVRNENDSLFLDSVLYRYEYERALKKMKDLLFWDLFGAQFIDNGFSQNFSFGFQPQFVSWLTTDATYNSRYRWDWTDYGRGDRSVSANSSLTTSLTLRIAQILSDLGAGEEGSNLEQPPPAGKGKDNYFPDKGKFGPPSPEGKNPFEMDPKRNPFEDQKIPDKFGDSGAKSPASPSLPPAEGTLPGLGDIPPDQGTDSLITIPPDTGQKRAPHPRINPLKLMATGLGRLRDVRWDYTLSNDTRNNAVERGQAGWKYRLGFTRLPGLAKAPGFATRDSYTRTDDHRFSSSGLDIIRTLSISNLGYNYRLSRSGALGQVDQVAQQETGSTATTVYQYFGDGGKAIKQIPIANWTARWSGLGDLEWVKKYASSVSVENSFQGSRTESWKRNPGGPREPNRIEYEKNYNPLSGITISWIWGFQSNLSYRWSRRVTDERTGGNSKSRNTTSSISVGSNYSTRDFRIPIPVWPFKNLRLKNSAAFSLTFESSLQKSESAGRDNIWTGVNETSTWRFSPGMEYSFSTAVKGSFNYEYAVRKTKEETVKSQEFGFRVNISIRG